MMHASVVDVDFDFASVLVFAYQFTYHFPFLCFLRLTVMYSLVYRQRQSKIVCV